jgi:hypothetical protein
MHAAATEISRPRDVSDLLFVIAARDVFNLIDKDRSRTLDKAEFSTALKRMGLGLTEDQVRECAVTFQSLQGDIFGLTLGSNWRASGR